MPGNVTNYFPFLCLLKETAILNPMNLASVNGLMLRATALTGQQDQDQPLLRVLDQTAIIQKVLFSLLFARVVPLVFVFIFVGSGAKEELSMSAEVYELPTGYIPSFCFFLRVRFHSHIF